MINIHIHIIYLGVETYTYLCIYIHFGSLKKYSACIYITHIKLNMNTVRDDENEFMLIE